jgi:hypothetical protein
MWVRDRWISNGFDQENNSSRVFSSLIMAPLVMLKYSISVSLYDQDTLGTDNKGVVITEVKINRCYTYATWSFVSSWKRCPLRFFDKNIWDLQINISGDQSLVEILSSLRMRCGTFFVYIAVRLDRMQSRDLIHKSPQIDSGFLCSR